MVVFVCGDCNDVLKKNAVDTHLNRCSCSVISCCDCGKNFSDDGYKAHTQCISEDRKYGPQDEKNVNIPDKGQKRQQDWLNKIKEAVSKVNLSGPTEMALNKLLEYPNIPRKKSKFINFASSCVGIRKPEVVEQIWNIFEEANKATDESKPDKSKPDKSKPDESKPDESKPEDSNDELKETKKVKKDKSKRKAEKNTNGDDSSVKSRKKKKHKRENEATEQSSENQHVEF
ncbi:cell growth-regulating nucleolar protein [Tetranychus urticae]|uniref:Zinc finger C2H2 LYAR-type domain-containing protein n=1 Tax=Tetranychus urticae TaxID=32264 RepID=T1KZI9_TETUR|nr:cell growth-regulating nucleolar protein [Tetranychus urticae]